MEGKRKGKEGRAEAGNACGRSRSDGQGGEMENHFQWKYCCAEALRQQFGTGLLIMAFSYFEYELLNAQGHHCFTT